MTMPFSARRLVRLDHAGDQVAVAARRTRRSAPRRWPRAAAAGSPAWRSSRRSGRSRAGCRPTPGRRCRRRPAPGRRPMAAPVLRSISTRAWLCAPSVCRYAVSSAVSIAARIVSNGISRSRSRARSAARSMFTSPRPPRRRRRRRRRRSSSSSSSSASSSRLELDLDPARARGRRSATSPALAVDVQHRRRRRRRPSTRPVTRRAPTLTSRPDVAPPVPGQGQRPVHAGRADLQLVLAGEQLAPGLLGGVERLGDRPGDVGDVVQADAAVGVDHDPHHVPPAGPGDGEVLQVVAGRGRPPARRQRHAESRGAAAAWHRGGSSRRASRCRHAGSASLRHRPPRPAGGATTSRRA